MQIKIKLGTVPMPPVIHTITLSGLNSEDLRNIRGLCSRIGGSPWESTRGVFDKLADALDDAGIEEQRASVDGSIHFEDYNDKNFNRGRKF